MTDHCAQVEPLLSAWLDRALNRSESARVAAHLPACRRCQGEVSSLQRTVSLLRAAPPRALPDDLRAALASTAPAQLRLGPGPVRRAARRVARFGTALFLTVLAALGATAYAIGGAGSPPTPQVAVPLDGYVHDHLARMTMLPGGPPVLVEVGR